MSKLNVTLAMIAILTAPIFLSSCRSISDDIAKMARQGSKVGDDIPQQVAVPNNRTTVSPIVAKNVDQHELLNKCTRQTGKSAVTVAWEQAKSSGFQVSEQYLLNVARDAIQKCLLGKVGDKVLDELAKLAVSEFKQENPQAEQN
ncbi:hypothetical protein [Floridanema aerugineum]|uniref:Lipoprotein n=1 Tax=Floridaenema aerugineum BLCC-F46 TaxID=3153654 RepID=A0ABV4WZQ5_9CYAN